MPRASSGPTRSRTWPSSPRRAPRFTRSSHGRGPDVGLRTALTAAATFGAYLLVLAALELAPAAPVSAVRESSVVIAAILAAVFLRERVGGRKIAGAIAVAAGVGR